MGKFFNKVKLNISKNSPTILVVVGVGGVIVSTVMACKATKKAYGIIDNCKHDLVAAEEACVVEKSNENDVEVAVIDNKKLNKEKVRIYSCTGLEFAKLYGPSALVMSVSLGCIIGSHNILSKRNAALTAAYATLDQAYKEYRKNVIERYGEDVDTELKYNVKVKKDKEGNKIIEATEETAKYISNSSQYARFFDETNPYWDDSAEYNLMFIKNIQQEANERLIRKGFLTLNEVYSALGFKETQAGMIMGWVYDNKYSDSDNFIDFGIYDIHNPAKRDFINGLEKAVLLDFNVVNIYQDMKYLGPEGRGTGNPEQDSIDIPIKKLIQGE